VMDTVREVVSRRDCGTIDLSKVRNIVRKESERFWRPHEERLARKIAKNLGFRVIYHGGSWIFKAKSGEKIQMAPGYYVEKNGTPQWLDMAKLEIRW